MWVNTDPTTASNPLLFTLNTHKTRVDPCSFQPCWGGGLTRFDSPFAVCHCRLNRKRINMSCGGHIQSDPDRDSINGNSPVTRLHPYRTESSVTTC